MSTTTDQTRIALITGAARGIGAATARCFAASGWQVHQIDAGFGPGADARCHTVDVRDFAAIEALIERIESGSGPIGALVNCAGITRDAMFHRLDPDSQWHPVLDVNLTGPFNLCRAVVPRMRGRRAGRIVNLASMNGLRGQPGQANYSAAKAGLIGMTRTLALELAGFGVTANCIAPGFIDTDMTRALRPDIREAEIARIPVGRPGTPEEVAELALYLCSDRAGFITGETISINGGQLMA